MIRRSFRIGLTLGLLAGLAFALVKMLGGRPHQAADVTPVPAEPWPRLREEPAARTTPEPATVAERPVAPAEPATPAATAKPVTPSPVAKKAAPSRKAAAKKAPAKRAAPRTKAPTSAWVEPTGAVCPTTHPVKAKLASKIFHLPGMLNYERTKPDRCYRDAAAADSDGLRPAKR